MFDFINNLRCAGLMLLDLPQQALTGDLQAIVGCICLTGIYAPAIYMVLKLIYQETWRKPQFLPYVRFYLAFRHARASDWIRQDDFTVKLVILILEETNNKLLSAHNEISHAVRRYNLNSNEEDIARFEQERICGRAREVARKAQTRLNYLHSVLDTCKTREGETTVKMVVRRSV